MTAAVFQSAASTFTTSQQEVVIVHLLSARQPLVDESLSLNVVQVCYAEELCHLPPQLTTHNRHRSIYKHSILVKGKSRALV